MTTVICAAATLVFLLGAFYGYASSPNYVKILSYAIGCEIFALIGFGYGLLHSKKFWRIPLWTGCGLALMVLGQAAIRLARLLLR